MYFATVHHCIAVQCVIAEMRGRGGYARKGQRKSWTDVMRSKQKAQLNVCVSMEGKVNTRYERRKWVSDK